MALSQIHGSSTQHRCGHDGQRKRVAHMPTATTTTEDSRSKFGRKLPTRVHDEGILKWRLPSGRALARRFNFSQASLCNAFLSILEVFSRYGNSHGPGGRNPYERRTAIVGTGMGIPHETVTFAAIAMLAGFRSRR